MDINHEKQNIEDLTKQKWYYYNLYKEYDQKLKEAIENVQNRCEHEWEIDRSYSDHNTIYTCKICGK